ncbi:hypothetical protein EsDP_00006155 [Epichloe bromicola]|uniref:Glycosyl transferase CAP10 domain-containing protein n=1 Tax=Epichloe bromicola TaxID=79588 RepID=A0ABQ0CX95_9HYPO
MDISLASFCMWQPEAGQGSATLGAVFGAIAADVATHKLTKRSSEMHSEALSWFLLPFLLKYIRVWAKKDNGLGEPLQDTTRAGTRACWLVAVGVAVAAFCATETDAIGVVPALTPILLMLGEKLCKAHTNTGAMLMANMTWTGTRLWGSFAVAAFQIYILSDFDYVSVAISCLELLGLVCVYATFLPRSANNHFPIPFIDVEAQLPILAPRIVVALLVAVALQGVALGFVPFSVTDTALVGITKAVRFFFYIKLARNTAWTSVTVVRMFGVCSSRNPYIQSSESQAIAHILGCALTLGQLNTFLFKNTTSRKLLWTLMLVPILPYLVNAYDIQSAKVRVRAISNAHKHPLQAIIEAGKNNFHALLTNQSTSFTGAAQSYRDRYGMEPPPKFDSWFEYASEHKSKIIDNFDIMYSSIAPFWNVSGHQVRQAILEVQQSPQNDVWTCTFSGQLGKTSCVHQWRSFDRHISELFNTKTMADVRGTLPDFEFLVNHLDEPRVLFPPNSTARKGIMTTDLSHKPTWSKLVQHCKAESQALHNTIETYGLPFVQDRHQSLNLCQHGEYKHTHGLFVSPMSMRLVEGMVPILSTGAPSTMGDILFPSPAYTEKQFEYSSGADPDWQLKKNNLYWAGFMSGGFTKNDQWKRFHRQRFVGLAQNLDRKQHVYLANSGDSISSITSPFLNSRSYDVSFTNKYNGADTAKREQTFFYRMKPLANKNEAFHSRLVFDLDGNGISGRWYKLLASKSAPLKQTLLREWHDDRLVPWAHYIPVSQGMEELPELVEFLTSTTQGQQYAKEVAEQGADWFRQALRQEDVDIYLYRLFLELARLQDPGRPARTT